MLHITRDDVVVAVAPGATLSSATQAKVWQIELRSRLFLDVDVVQIVGGRPSIHLGLDAIALSGVTSTLNPVFGAGFRREAF